MKFFDEYDILRIGHDFLRAEVHIFIILYHSIYCSLHNIIDYVIIDFEWYKLAIHTVIFGKDLSIKDQFFMLTSNKINANSISLIFLRHLSKLRFGLDQKQSQLMLTKNLQ